MHMRPRAPAESKLRWQHTLHVRFENFLAIPSAKWALVADLLLPRGGQKSATLSGLADEAFCVLLRWRGPRQLHLTEAPSILIPTLHVLFLSLTPNSYHYFNGLACRT